MSVRYLLKQYQPEEYEITICDTMDEALAALEIVKNMYKTFIFDDPNEPDDISTHKWDIRTTANGVEVLDNSFPKPEDRYIIFSITSFESGKMYNVNHVPVSDSHNIMYDIDMNMSFASSLQSISNKK